MQDRRNCYCHLSKTSLLPVLGVISFFETHLPIHRCVAVVTRSVCQNISVDNTRRIILFPVSKTDGFWESFGAGRRVRKRFQKIQRPFPSLPGQRFRLHTPRNTLVVFLYYVMKTCLGVYIC